MTEYLNSLSYVVTEKTKAEPKRLTGPLSYEEAVAKLEALRNAEPWSSFGLALA